MDEVFGDEVFGDEVFRIDRVELSRLRNGWSVFVVSDYGGGSYVVADIPRSTAPASKYHAAAAEAETAIKAGIEAWVADLAHR